MRLSLSPAATTATAQRSVADSEWAAAAAWAASFVVGRTTSLEPCARFLSGPHADGTAHLLTREWRFVSAVNAAATAATGPSRSIAKEPLVKNPEDFCLARRLVENAARAGGKQLSVSNGGLAEIEPREGIQRHVTAA